MTTETQTWIPTVTVKRKLLQRTNHRLDYHHDWTVYFKANVIESRLFLLIQRKKS